MPYAYSSRQNLVVILRRALKEAEDARIARGLRPRTIYRVDVSSATIKAVIDELKKDPLENQKAGDHPGAAKESRDVVAAT